MKVLLFGATGMVGQGVLRECLLADDVELVETVGRSASGGQNPKLREVVHEDLWHYDAIAQQLAGFDACFFCLGVTSSGNDGSGLRTRNLWNDAGGGGNFEPAESADDVYLCVRRGDGQFRARRQHVGAGERENGKCAVEIAVRCVHVSAGDYPAAVWSEIQDQACTTCFIRLRSRCCRC